MKTVKAFGVLVLVSVILAAIGGCRSKEPAKQDKPDVWSASKPDAVPTSKPDVVRNVEPPKITLPVTPPEAPPAKELTLDLGGKVTMKVTLIPSGKFMMGSPKDEKGRKGDEGLPPGEWENGSPQREVAVSNPFYMGIYDVTVEQYGQFVKDTGHQHNEQRYKERADYPVLSVGVGDAQDFCKWLSKKTGKAVNLPSEEQWEYACRAGSKTRFSYGDDNDYTKLSDYAWYNKNSGGGLRPVGQKKPNAWGLYDMHGLVWQWVAEANSRMGSGCWRGGCCYSPPEDCRSAFRGYLTENVGPDDIGFRVIVDLKKD